MGGEEGVELSTFPARTPTSKGKGQSKSGSGNKVIGGAGCTSPTGSLFDEYPGSSVGLMGNGRGSHKPRAAARAGGGGGGEGGEIASSAGPESTSRSSVVCAAVRSDENVDDDADGDEEDDNNEDNDNDASCMNGVLTAAAALHQRALATAATVEYQVQCAKPPLRFAHIFDTYRSLDSALEAEHIYTLDRVEVAAAAYAQGNRPTL